MSVKFSGKLVGTNSTEIKHELSGATIKTMAPIDNGGDGSSFSPTDLFAASLGACSTTIMGMFAEKNKIPLLGISFELEKEMTTSPRRVAKLTVTYSIKTNCTEDDFKRLVGAGKACPVRKSLPENTEIIENYVRDAQPAIRMS